VTSWLSSARHYSRRMCIGRDRHSFDHRDICRQCGDARPEYRYEASVCPCHCKIEGDEFGATWADITITEEVCEYHREAKFRQLAVGEQLSVMARLRAEEEEVASLYGWKGFYMLKSFDYGTPTYWKERYPEWQRERARRAELAKQRRALRQGQAMMRDIRTALRRGVVPSLLLESPPARTSLD